MNEMKNTVAPGTAIFFCKKICRQIAGIKAKYRSASGVALAFHLNGCFFVYFFTGI
jgi:hypothetical protein